ncbi:CLUMA_CG012451, isoform A [Clunio marinus]|uniref:CLUMA_CG012451, isoform A n=1 Tax=Clunio marinus TaxID=568069 RepID=A0A1J1IEN7_9DIPT|nr:CLUMA_CG012451, isoform A [Clunio marinus]
MPDSLTFSFSEAFETFFRKKENVSVIYHSTNKLRSLRIKFKVSKLANANPEHLKGKIRLHGS